MIARSLSIIVPVLDEAPRIGALLDQLERQRRLAGSAFPGGIELIVVDGGSSDASVALCSGRVDRLLHAPRGRGSQLHAGAAQASGDLLWFVHADTGLPDGAVGLIAQALHAHPNAAWGRFDVRIDGRSPMLALVARMMNWRSACSGIATGDQAIFVRRASMERAGGFPVQPLMEDIELSRRLLRLPHGRPLRLREPVITSGRRWEARGVWRTIWLMWRLRWRYWRGVPADELARAYR